jgi:type IV pilus assembly protein PilV
MIEILVTVLILAIGFLGLASLQSVGLTYNQGAYYRTQATILAQDLADRIRSNINEKTGVFATNMTTATLVGPQPTCTGSAASCSTAQLATYDLIDWCKKFTDCNAAAPTEVLPSSSGSLSFDAGTGVYTVTISWLEKVNTSAPDNVKSLSVNFL